MRIRNLSATGALIEGAVIPSPATEVRLARGSLSIMGEVVWCNGGRAGLKFHSEAQVAQWLPNARVAHAQQQVDELVHRIKQAPTGLMGAPTGGSSFVVRQDIAQARLMLDELASAFAEDNHVLARFGPKLQAQDLTAQLLAKFEQSLPT